MHARSLATVTLFAAASLTLTLVGLWPRATIAEEIADSERMGEWDEGGARFGDVVVKGELVKDANGWVLVRTMENKSDAPATCRIEEHVLRTETMQGARVEPPPYAVLIRGVTVTLAAHEKRKLGVQLPSSVGAQLDEDGRRASSIAWRRAAALVADRVRDPVFTETFHRYEVAYLTPLPAGATAAKPDPSRLGTRPAGYPMVGPPARRPDGVVARGL